VVATDGTSALLNFSDTGDTGGMLIDTLTAILYPSAAFTGIANNMQVSIQNTLRAFTGAAGEDALIQKKFTLVTQTLTSVPVPAAAWLLGGALAGLGWLRRLANRA